MSTYIDLRRGQGGKEMGTEERRRKKSQGMVLPLRSLTAPRRRGWTASDIDRRVLSEPCLHHLFITQNSRLRWKSLVLQNPSDVSSLAS